MTCRTIFCRAHFTSRGELKPAIPARCHRVLWRGDGAQFELPAAEGRRRGRSPRFINQFAVNEDFSFAYPGYGLTAEPWALICRAFGVGEMGGL